MGLNVGAQTAFSDNACRHSHHRAIFRNILHHHRIRAHLDIVAHGDIAKNLGSAAHAHVVAKRWTIGVIGITNGDLLVDPTVPSNPSRSDDRANAMLNDEAWTKFTSVNHESGNRAEEYGGRPYQNFSR